MYKEAIIKMFPIITESRQKLYEKVYISNKNFNNEIPCICGYYGRACRKMGERANSIPCQRCTLSIFVSTINVILDTCEEKEKMGIEKLYDSDFLDIQEKLEEKMIHVDISYIYAIFEALNFIQKGD